MTDIFDEILGRERGTSRPALLGQGACDHGALIAQADALALKIRAFGIGQGDVIAVCVPPSPAYPVIMLAAYMARACFVFMNPVAAANEKAHVLENSCARLLITSLRADQTSNWACAAAEKIHEELRLLALSPASHAPTEPGDRILVYTSGSTSHPKGVVLSDQAISANVRAIVDNMVLGPGDRSIVFTPPAYTYAISQTLTHLWSGGATVQWPHGMMYPAQILKHIQEFRLTGLACNPTLMRILLQVEITSALDLGSVRYIKSAGQPLYSQLAQSMANLFPSARIVCTYGCTENSPRICHHWLPPDLPERDQAWSVGGPLQGVEVQVVGIDNAPLPVGQPGDILVGGTSLMRGYWREPELTAERIKDGMFRTGDIGVLDVEGRLSVLGRSDNIIGVGHEKVAPEEVEAILFGVNGVTDAAVGGIADPILDKAAVALIVSDHDPSDIVDRCRTVVREKLSLPKNPKQYRVVPAIPKTAYGKHDRKAIAKLIREVF